jgi:glycosyltransferase involved in cell wall biosynthesis/GT2 family glycosyltransferase
MTQNTGAASPLRIFVLHGSHGLTDHEAHGDGLVAWGFLSELARRGHRIHVATTSFRIKGELPPNLTLVTLNPKTGTKFGDYVAYALAARAEFERFAADAPVDVVHQMNPVLRGLSLGMISRKVAVVLGTFVGEWPPLDPASGKKRKRRSLSQRTQDVGKQIVDALSQVAATSLIIATPFAQNRLPLAYLMKRRIEHVHHGVDLELFHPGEEPANPERRARSVLYVGSLEYKKGVMILAQAFEQLLRRLPDARLVLIGDGGEEALLRTYFTDAGISGSVEWLGRQSRDGVARWMRSVDVLCAPSFGEPYGQNILEALASGKPVVATNAGGHPYLVDHRNGANVKPGDVNGFADALYRFLNDPELARNVGRHNRTVAEQRHAWSKVTRDLEAVYARAIARAGIQSRTRIDASAFTLAQPNPRLVIVVVTKNRPTDFARLYRSIREQSTQPERIVVIDQSDVKYLIEKRPDVIHIHDRSIKGITEARNAGIERIGDAPYTVFLDDDAELANDVVAEVLSAFAMHPDAIGLQCKVEQPLGRAVLEESGLGSKVWSTWERIFYRGFFNNRLGRTRPTSDEIERVHGCAMAFCSSLFQFETFDVSLLDYSYGEDWDFSRRALKYGRLYLAPAAHVVHHESPTNRYRQKRLLSQRWTNFLYFYEKYKRERTPLDSLWRVWWTIGETAVWLKKGYGFPKIRRPSD